MTQASSLAWHPAESALLIFVLASQATRVQILWFCAVGRAVCGRQHHRRTRRRLLRKGDGLGNYLKGGDSSGCAALADASHGPWCPAGTGVVEWSGWSGMASGRTGGSPGACGSWGTATPAAGPSGAPGMPKLDRIRAAPETPHPYHGCTGAGGTESLRPVQGVVVEHPAAVRVGAHLEPLGCAAGS